MAILKRIAAHPLFLLIAGIAIVILSVIASSEISVALFGSLGHTESTELLSSVLGGLLAIFAYWIFVHFIERRPFSDFGLKKALPEWLFGAAIGFGVMSLTVGAIALLGGYRVIGTHDIGVLVPVLGMAIISGTLEEILFRGLFFRFMEQWLGSWIALVLSAALFGFLHITNPNASWLAAVAIAIEAGLMLGAIYMLTRRLWAAIGIHMAWNFTQGGVYGVAVSGIETQGLLVPRMEGPEYLTGGAFGAEASIPAILICTAAGVILLYYARKRGNFILPRWKSNTDVLDASI